MVGYLFLGAEVNVQSKSQGKIRAHRKIILYLEKFRYRENQHFPPYHIILFLENCLDLPFHSYIVFYWPLFYLV